MACSVPRFLLLAAVLGLPACTRPAPPATLVLVSLDGFRYEYLDRGVTPRLGAMASAGARAPLVPVFPTKTFPNHYTLVTGLYPEAHGIVNNSMYDPDFDAEFSLRHREAIADARWWGGEPLWVTLERAGRATAPMFWPGSEAAIGGVRPTHWLAYDGGMPNGARVRHVLDWLALPDSARPAFVTLYFSDVDDAGHRADPDSPAVHPALAEVDRQIGRLLDGITALGLEDRVNVVITSDHGMAATSPDSLIFLDDYLDLRTVRLTDWYPVLHVWPRDGNAERVYRALAGAHPRLSVWRRQEVPAALHHRAHRRVPPVVGLAAEGWAVTTRRAAARDPDRFLGGTHGYADTLTSMQGVFIARGPAFRAGVTGPPVGSVHLYALLAGVLQVEPAPHQGHADSTRRFLR